MIFVDFPAGLDGKEALTEFGGVDGPPWPTGAHLFVKNPSYIQAPPPLNNETVKVRIYENARYPEGEMRLQ